MTKFEILERLKNLTQSKFITDDYGNCYGERESLRFDTRKYDKLISDLTEDVEKEKIR